MLVGNVKVFDVLILLLSIIIVGLLFTLKVNFSKIENAQDVRHRSIILADELRQSSDDLTRFARLYVHTRNGKYLNYYDHILAIRDGQVERPDNYEGVFWDLVISGDTTLLTSKLGPKISFKDRMSVLGFSKSDFYLLETAQNRSNNLTKIENMAFDIIRKMQSEDVESLIVQDELRMAQRLVYGQPYLSEKAKIMEPIKKFQEQVNERTTRNIEVIKSRTKKLIIVTVLAAGFLFSLIFVLTIQKYRED